MTVGMCLSIVDCSNSSINDLHNSCPTAIPFPTRGSLARQCRWSKNTGNTQGEAQARLPHLLRSLAIRVRVSERPCLLLARCHHTLTLSEDFPSSPSGPDSTYATRSEGICCSAPSNAESFRFKADLLGDFKAECNTDQLSRCGLEGVGFAENVGILLGLVGPSESEL